MSGGGEYEPKDSRNVTANPRKSWRQKEDPREGRGEYEPADSRNVHGSAVAPDGRWTDEARKPPRADGEPGPPADGGRSGN